MIADLCSIDTANHVRKAIHHVKLHVVYIGCSLIGPFDELIHVSQERIGDSDDSSTDRRRQLNHS